MVFLGDLFDLVFYENIVEEMLKRDDVDGVLLGHGYRRGFEQAPSRNLIKKVEQLVDCYQKPVAIVIFAEEWRQRRKRVNIGQKRKRKGGNKDSVDYC